MTAATFILSSLVFGAMCFVAGYKLGYDLGFNEALQSFHEKLRRAVRHGRLDRFLETCDRIIGRPEKLARLPADGEVGHG